MNPRHNEIIEFYDEQSNWFVIWNEDDQLFYGLGYCDNEDSEEIEIPYSYSIVTFDGAEYVSHGVKEDD